MTFISKSGMARGLTRPQLSNHRRPGHSGLTPIAPRFGGNEQSQALSNPNPGQPKDGGSWLNSLPLMAVTVLSAVGLFFWAKLGGRFRSLAPAPQTKEAQPTQKSPEATDVEPASPQSKSEANLDDFEMVGEFDVEDLPSGVISMPDSPRSGTTRPALTPQAQTELRKALSARL